MKPRILIVSNQVRAIDGTGGLGDVAAGLAKALITNENLDVRIFIPGYRAISGTGVADRFNTVILSNLQVPFGGQLLPARVCQYFLPTFNADDPRVPCYLLCMEAFDQARDSPEQAILLARGTIEFLKSYGNFCPDVIHCNDWHTGLIPVYLSNSYRNSPLPGSTSTVYTTHNIGYFYQGAFPDDTFTKPPETLLFQAGFEKNLFQPMQTRSLEHQNRFNFTKGGLGFADLINTVSITYAREIQTPAFGGGLDQLLLERSHDLLGIVNGIDTAEWDPERDPLIAPFNFSKSDPIDIVIRKKKQIRNLLQCWEKNNLKPYTGIKETTLLMAFIGRITDQKAAILMPILERLCLLNAVQIVILGSAHPKDPVGRRYVVEMNNLSQKYPENLFVYEGFEIELSHLIYASADLLLMPSLYEPCGLAQMIAMHYGTLPVVHFVGGLADTVIDEQEGMSANGFGYRETRVALHTAADIPSAADLLYATVLRAAAVFKDAPSRWSALTRNAMTADVSWRIPARRYRKVYNAAVSKRIES